MTEHNKVKNEKNETLKAGCVVVNNQDEVLLVTDNGKEIWSFPKGHVEPGETLEQTALREVKEETGYVVEIIKRLSDVTYSHGQTGELIRVALYLAKPIEILVVPEEKTKSMWFHTGKARDILNSNLSHILDWPNPE